MFIAAMNTAMAPRMVVVLNVPDNWSIPPTRIMPLMAFVTLIKGVCRAGLTLQTSCQPTKHASMNTVKWESFASGATRPRPNSARPITTSTIGLIPPAEPFAACSCETETSAFDATLRVGTPGSGGAGGVGGGHIILPSCRMIAPRTTASSRST